MSVAAAVRNRHVVLRSRPGANAEPKEENFIIEECEKPTSSCLKPGHILIKNLYLSMDPALRCRMNEDSGVDYMSAWQVGQPVDGLGGVGMVEASSHPLFNAGDLVTATFLWPWAEYFIMEHSHIRKFTSESFTFDPSLPLTLLGLTGLTAYLGLKEKGHIVPDGGQTVVISAAAGATGSLAGQIAHLLGAKRVVGICGTDEKCDLLTKDLGFDAAVNYRHGNLAAYLVQACSEGVHVYFDNVGGDVSETVIEQMVPNSHVVLCGQIATYNSDMPYPPPISPHMQQVLKDKNITRQRFLVLQYAEKFDGALAVLAKWYTDGKIKVKVTVAEDLENAGKAFVSMMSGGNIGKQLVKVSS